MNQHDLQSILAELGLDPNDAALKQTLQQVLDNRPNAQIDDQFRMRLRHQLQQRMAEPQVLTSNSSINLISTIMQKFMVPALVAVVILVAGGVWYTNQSNPGLINLGGSNQLLSGEYKVDEVSANSFGDLSKVAIVNSERNQSGGGNAAMGMGGDTAVAESDKMIAPGSGGGGDASILPYPSGFDFNYEGEVITGLNDAQLVMKRVKPVQNESLVSRIISFFSFGLVDLTKFTNARIQNFAFVEDKEYGLGVNVDLTYGSVSLYQNWEKWPQPQYTCDNNYCGAIPRLTEKDLPSDEEAIAIAEQFVNDYGISREGYGTPIVYEQMPWRIAYEQAPDKSRFYFPEAVSVLYPLVLDGSTVYDEGGNPSGMYVGIDVRTRKVNNVYGLDSKQFQRSQYTGETDTKRILEVAERGGYRNWGWDNGEGRNVTLDLDTPTIQLVRMWYSPEPNKAGEELYVPSLVFPIKNATENNYWRKNVVVPLVKDLLDNENQGGGPVMPLERPAQPAVEEPMPVEPDGGIGDTPDASTSSSPAVMPL